MLSVNLLDNNCIIDIDCIISDRYSNVQFLQFLDYRLALSFNDLGLAQHYSS